VNEPPDLQRPRPKNEKRKLAYLGKYGGTWGSSSRPPTAVPFVSLCAHLRGRPCSPRPKRITYTATTTFRLVEGQYTCCARDAAASTHMLMPPVKIAIAVRIVSRYPPLRWLKARLTSDEHRCTNGHVGNATVIDLVSTCESIIFVRRNAAYESRRRRRAELITHNMFEKSIATIHSSLLGRTCGVRLDGTAKRASGMDSVSRWVCRSYNAQRQVARDKGARLKKGDNRFCQESMDNRQLRNVSRGSGRTRSGKMKGCSLGQLSRSREIRGSANSQSLQARASLHFRCRTPWHSPP
jgi:hypothetical protein